MAYDFLGNSKVSPQQYADEFGRLMQSYNNVYNQYNPAYTPAPAPVPTPPPAPTGGEWRYVKSLEEVENTPTRVDGTATLLVDFSNGVFWSKKFNNGQHIIQAYKFMPLNTSKEDIPPAEEKKLVDNNDVLASIIKRLDNIEDRLPKQKEKKEDVNDKSK